MPDKAKEKKEFDNKYTRAVENDPHSMGDVLPGDVLTAFENIKEIKAGIDALIEMNNLYREELKVFKLNFQTSMLMRGK